MAKFLLSYMSSPKARKLLRLFSEGHNLSEVAEKTSMSKQLVYYYLKRFLANKLLYEFAPGKPRIYELSAFGKRLLTTSERGVKEPLLMESYDMKFRLLQNNVKRDCGSCKEQFCTLPRVGTTNNCRIFWEKLGDPNNWQKWGFKYCGIRVERNDGLFPTVVIRSGEISGFGPYELVAEAGTIIALVRAKLHDLGLVLDDVGQPLHEPMFHTYTVEAEILNKQGTVYTGCGHIDASPPDKVPHEERNFGQQENYMHMPVRVRNMEQQVTQQTSQIASLTDKVNRIEGEVLAISSSMNRLADAVSCMAESVGKLSDALSRALPKEEQPQKLTTETNKAIPKDLYE
jgi:hypothetical protein